MIACRTQSYENQSSRYKLERGIVSAIAHKPGAYKLGKHCVDVGEPDILVLR